MGQFSYPGGGSYNGNVPFMPTGTAYPIKVTTTTNNKHTPVPQKPHLFTYSQPVFAANAMAFYGLTIPVSLGRRAIVGVPIFASPFKISGGNTYCDFAVSVGYQGAQFADIVATNVSRIWADGTLIFDANVPTGWNTAGDIKFGVYKGTEDQMPDPVLVGWLGEEQPIAFRGEIYVMFYDFPLTKYGFTHVPVIRVEIIDTFTDLTNVYDTARINGATAIRGASNQIAIDWYRRRIYQEDASDSSIHVYDFLNMIEIFSFIPSVSGLAGFPGQFYAEPKFGYLIAAAGLSNSAIHYCLDPNTGNVLGQFGVDSGSLTNSATNFVNPTDFCEMRNSDDTAAVSYILCVSILTGQLGVLELNSSGTLTYKWTHGDAVSILDIFEVIGGLQSAIFTCCPGDKVVSTSDVATAFCASLLEVTRLVVHNGGVRHEVMWRPPSGHNVNWIFLDPDTDDCIVLHRQLMNNEMYFSRVRLRDNVRGKANPDPGTSGGGVSGADYADAVYTAGPIPRMPDMGSDATSTGALGDQDALNNFNGWQFSQFGSSHTLGYAHTDRDPQFTVLNIQDGTWASFNLTSWALEGETQSGNLDLHTGHIWDGDAQMVIGWSAIGTSGASPAYTFGPARVLPFIASSGGGIPLYTILGWLMAYAGFDEDDLNVSTDLSDTFSGALVQEIGINLWDMLDDMSKALQFEVFESEGQVKFTKVGRGSSLSITYALDPDDDLMSIDGSDDEGKGNNENNPGARSSYAGFSTERDWNLDAPQTIELRYLDENQEYTVNVARANKTTFPVSTTENDKVERYDVPLIMTPEKAFVYAARALYDAYAGIVFHEMHLGSKYLRLEPGDVLSLTMNDMDYVLKVSEGTINSDYSMSVRGTSFCNLEAISTTGEAPINLGGQTVAGPSLTQGYIVDTPPLEPEDCITVTDSNLRFYSEVTSYGQAAWRGGRILFSDIPAGPYTEVFRDTVTGGSYVGIAAAALSGGLSMTTDFISSLDVSFTVMPAALTGSEGYMLVGRTGRWEFMYYSSVVASTGSSRQYTFSNLVRGMRGTEWHMRDHVAGDIVLLYPNYGHLNIVELPITNLDDTIYFKALGINEDEDSFPASTFTMVQNFEKPWAPTSLKAHTVSGGSSGLTLSWMRRTRLEAGVWGVTGSTLPLETGWTEQYEIEILGPTGNILRTVTGALTNSYTYASGDVTTDFGSVPATISFNVYQISPVVGRGFAGSITTDVLSAT